MFIAYAVVTVITIVANVYEAVAGTRRPSRKCR